MDTIGKRIKFIRGKLSQLDFAKSIGLQRSATISDIEKDKIEPTDMMLLAIEYKFSYKSEWVRTGNGPDTVSRLKLKEDNEKYVVSNKKQNNQINLLNVKLNKLFNVLPSNIQMGVVSAIESYILQIENKEVKEEVKEAYDDFKKSYMEEELRKMG